MFLSKLKNEIVVILLFGFVLQILMYFDYVFTAIFALEVVIKVSFRIRH